MINHCHHLHTTLTGMKVIINTCLRHRPRRCQRPTPTSHYCVPGCQGLPDTQRPLARPRNSIRWKQLGNNYVDMIYTKSPSGTRTWPTRPTSPARNLGVMMDSDLNFNFHIKTITKSASYLLNNRARIKGFMSKEDRENDCNRVFTDTKKVQHVTPVLKSLIN